MSLSPGPLFNGARTLYDPEAEGPRCGGGPSIFPGATMSLPRGRSSVGRASASQAEGRGFEPHRPLALVQEGAPWVPPLSISPSTHRAARDQRDIDHDGSGNVCDATDESANGQRCYVNKAAHMTTAGTTTFRLLRQHGVWAGDGRSLATPRRLVGSLFCVTAGGAVPPGVVGALAPPAVTALGLTAAT